MKKIYSVRIHVKPKKKVHIYWFTDSQKAAAFLESVKGHPNVLDYEMLSMDADVFEEYKDGMDAPLVQIDETNRSW